MPIRMSLVACATHWYTAALFLAPLALIGGGLWLSGRREDRRREMAKRSAQEPEPRVEHAHRAALSDR